MEPKERITSLSHYLVIVNSSNQSLDTEEGINRTNDTNSSFNNVIKAASNSSWAKENSIDKSYSDSTRSSYEEQKRAEAAVSISKQKVDDWHKAKTVIDSQGASSSRDMYQEVVEGIKQTYGTDAKTAQKMADSYSSEAQRVWGELQKQDHYVENLVNDIGSKKAAISNNKEVQSFDNMNLISKDTEDEVRAVATNNGIDIDNFEGNLRQQRDELKQKHSDLTSENAIQYKSVKYHNEAEARDLENQAKKYEEDRIGKGVIAQGFSSALNEITRGHAGESIGKTDSNKSKIHKGAYENAVQTNKIKNE